MKTEFTPGPWEVSPDTNHEIWAGDGTYIVATLPSMGDDSAPPNDEYTPEANAHLIAAAPEMYEALKDAEWAAYGFCPQCSKSFISGHRAQCILANALAKANGRAA